MLIELFLQRIYGIEKERHQENAKAVHPYAAHTACRSMISGCVIMLVCFSASPEGEQKRGGRSRPQQPMDPRYNRSHVTCQFPNSYFNQHRCLGDRRGLRPSASTLHAIRRPLAIKRFNFSLVQKPTIYNQPKEHVDKIKWSNTDLNSLLNRKKGCPSSVAVNMSIASW